MWRRAIFIRHNCGERKNTVGHRWCNKTKEDKKSALTYITRKLNNFSFDYFSRQEVETRVFSPSTFTVGKQRPKASETPRKKVNKRLSDSTPSKSSEIEERKSDTTTTTTEAEIEAEIEAESHKIKRTKLKRFSLENKENIPEKQTSSGFSKQLKLD